MVIVIAIVIVIAMSMTIVALMATTATMMTMTMQMLRWNWNWHWLLSSVGETSLFFDSANSILTVNGVVGQYPIFQLFTCSKEWLIT